MMELASMSDAAFERLEEATSQIDPSAEPTQVIEGLSKRLESETHQGGQIVAMVIGLRGVVERTAFSEQDVLDAVVKDATETKKWLNADLKDQLRARLAVLIGLRAVALASKAFDLMSADASTFSDVRIVTDVRPIFSGSGSDLMCVGSVIVHHLNLEILEGDGQYCTLTTSDLYKLRRTVDRAIEKDTKLRQALQGGALLPLKSDSGE